MRELPYPDLDFGEVRRYASDLANRSSLRTVAATVRLGHSTFHNFLEGATPHPRVRAALGAWYMREMGDNGAARIALDALVEPFAPERRGRLRMELLSVLEQGFREAGRGAPPWLVRLRDGDG